MMHSCTSGDAGAGTSLRNEENIAVNVADRFASPPPAKNNVAGRVNAQQASPLRAVCLDTPYDEAAAPDSPSVHSLSYSTQATALDRSTFTTCLMGDAIPFASASESCNESLCRVNYFSKPNVQYVKEHVWEQTVFCSDFGLAEVWTGKHVELCQPAMMPSTQRPAERMLRIEYARKIAAQTQQFYNADRQRQTVLGDSMNSCRQAKTAILASIPESSKIDPATKMTGKPSSRAFNSSRPRAVALAAAEVTLASKHRWSQLADLRLASQYARLESMESILFLKQALRLWDTELISFRRSFNALLSSGVEDRSHIDIEGFQCPRHLMVQYHKRHLFRKLKKLHQASIDLSTLCTEMSIQFSCTEAIWLIESRDPRAAFQFALDAMNRAADADNEDGWIEAYMVLKAVHAMFKEDMRRYGSVETEVRLCAQYAAAKLEFVFCKKLLHAAYFHHQLCFWGDFKFHFDLMESQWTRLSEAIQKAMYMDPSTRPSSEVMDTICEDTKLAQHVLTEWNICVLTRISQFFSFKWRSIIPNFDDSISINSSYEDSFRIARHSLMRCYEAASSMYREQSVIHKDEGVGAHTTFSLAEAQVILDTVESKLYSLFEEHSSALMSRAKGCVQTTTSKILESSEVVSTALVECNVRETVGVFDQCATLNTSICGFIEEIETIRKASILTNNADISDESKKKIQHFQAMVEYSKVQKNYCTFLPTELLASSLFTKIRGVRCLDREIKKKLTEYMASDMKLAIPNWKFVLESVVTAITKTCKILVLLRDKQFENVFKISPFNCSCCIPADIAGYKNCRCQVIEYWVNELVTFLDSYGRKVELEKDIQPQAASIGPDTEKEMWICLKDMMISLKNDPSLIESERDRQVIHHCESTVEDRLNRIDIERKLGVRRSHASRLLTVASSATLFLIVVSSLKK